jgi:hypothetical protein
LKELRIHLEMNCVPKNLLRLTPGGLGEWGGCKFIVNPPDEESADFVVALGSVRPLVKFFCSPSNTLLMVGEPPSKKIYPRGYYHQFHHLVDSHELGGHPRTKVTALGLPWHVGLERSTHEFRIGYDELTTMPEPTQKENKIAVVCSNLTATEGQRERLAFLEKLKDQLGDHIVHFGRGFLPIDDKLDAILPYRFQLVLENSRSPNYWTEKLADAYLGWAMPLYVGCPNLNQFFSDKAFIPLDVNDPDGVTKKMRELLDSRENTTHLSAVRQARHDILNTYNPFAWASRWVRLWHDPNAKKEMMVLRSHKAFRQFPLGMIYRLRSEMNQHQRRSRKPSQTKV